MQNLVFMYTQPLQGLSPNSSDLHVLLKDRFGLDSFRPGQLDVLRSVLNRRDTLAVMPTGGGKSLCYQLPALYFGRLVLVISPLIALMKDQVCILEQSGIPAGCLHSGQTLDERREVFAAIRAHQEFILFLSPERVQLPGFADWLKEQRLGLIAVDEAHCVSQWGPDFRQDYHRLAKLRELQPQVPILALTASATPAVLKDISCQLKLKDPVRHVHGFYRPNLFYQVEACPDGNHRWKMIRAAIDNTPDGRILIYGGTRQKCEDLAKQLQSLYQGVGFYHAGMTFERRRLIQEKMNQGELRILVATNAFGMGIDYPDVRLVMHIQLPASIESLYQEMGRAGRDQQMARCLLLHSRKDRGLHAFFISQSKAEARIVQQRWDALNTITEFVESQDCRHNGILTYFRDSNRIRMCGHCDVCAPDSKWVIHPSEESLV
jgi:ATP-dependent DNA helicase RecQ